MGKDVVERDVDEQSYTITQFAPKKAMRIYGQLLKHTDIFVNAVKGYDGNKALLQQEIDFGSIVARIGELTENDYLYGLLKDVVGCAIHAGHGELKDKFDMHLSKFGLIHMFKVAMACAEVNFESFFGESIGDLFSKATTMKLEKQTSTSGSGDQSSQE